MTTKYNRTSVLYDVGNDEKDLISLDWSLFSGVSVPTMYRVLEDDVQRPDRIASKIYGRTDYWWLLMKYNGIMDVWNDLYPGRILYCPSEADIQEFVNKVERNKRLDI